MKLSLLFGGASFEHEISIVSAITILQKLKGKHEISACIFLDGEHNFYLIESKNMTSKYFSSQDFKKAKRLEIGMGGFYESGMLGKKKLVVSNVILNLIHGGDGEDGVLAGLFSFFNIKFIGPRLEASTISFNKHLTKLYAKEIGVNALPYAILKRGDTPNLPFDFPIIIKPTCLGSSIGVNIANDSKELEYALDSAFEYSDEVIIEPFIKGVREYNLAGARLDSKFIFSVVEEPQKKDLLNFDDKYLDFSRTSEVLSAEISESLKGEMQGIFKKIYGEMFCGALIRCDFFVIDSKIYLNEINPIPGSMANYLFENFESVLESLANALPRTNHIKINYNYINKIQSAKGK
ncbi:D-alanine--D-alanine ligase [Helicobacter saguini]|uniref:D-alanine--D-alanine ligase n=1 Tax=Helicobacter saguini TaxID=1548018 RepID=A0A347VTN9_9HELI|nr:D-alanine--D-alanine ligase [Helicobacter saguini]MWV62021.1 D-alanine--D-alanine ligase [Helicobacter saguini]MWV67305.1 D-alanine--D-alanine ligase [Helicobacter saguini]MWV69658.1 D-alanine--D-alanine ligase [Helicobacter saguini]MWV73125.1 D-alanine--D-alanine ligase [Helicobacter saguini]TLD95511.1 D-alanine--D-alanine ligase [Helicobacter saguini]